MTIRDHMANVVFHNNNYLLRVTSLGTKVTYNSVIIYIASVIVNFADLSHVINSFNIRESFIITVVACFW